jgi:hypothetical protein
VEVATWSLERIHSLANWAELSDARSRESAQPVMAAALRRSGKRRRANPPRMCMFSGLGNGMVAVAVVVAVAVAVAATGAAAGAGGSEFGYATKWS